MPSSSALRLLMLLAMFCPHGLLLHVDVSGEKSFSQNIVLQQETFTSLPAFKRVVCHRPTLMLQPTWAALGFPCPPLCLGLCNLGVSNITPDFRWASSLGVSFVVSLLGSKHSRLSGSSFPGVAPISAMAFAHRPSSTERRLTVLALC